MKHYDVVALGELLIDFTSSGNSDQGNVIYEAHPGGAPCNVLAMLAKLGRTTAFLGKVGEDAFGKQLRQTVQQLGIDASGLRMDKEAPTTLAFVHNRADGEREFSFYRSPGADTGLTVEELDRQILANCHIFHFGSLSLTDEPARSATREAVALAKSAGALISFDPNLRPLLWQNLEDAKTQITWGCSQCDILKLADEELAFLTWESNLQSGIAAIRESFPAVRLFLITKGKEGSDCFCGGLHASAPTFPEVATIDTTGAGDTFLGCCLSHLVDRDPEQLDEDDLTNMLRYANAAASLVTTKKGVMNALPTPQEIAALARFSQEPQ